MQEPMLGPPPDEPRTRPPMPMWDRVKFILLFVGIWFLLVWNTYIEIEIVGGSVVDAMEEQLRDGAIWLGLAWLEVIRQLHYLMSEQWAGWHQFWSKTVFGGVNRRLDRLNDWNRYRLGRVLKWLGGIVVLAIVLGQVYDVPAAQALFELPATVWAALPMVLQVVFFMFLAVIQFVAIFWFMSRGGVEVIMPNDVRTRFSDVWGQDQVVDRVRENLLFLEAPEKIEEKGGYVPSGVLLWGPPGTGKTLVAEAAAGETGKPFVFVEPGAFTNMFFGVGVLKVKSLFRKIRKLAVRYGGVVAFFDEADSLGNRGRLSQSGGLPGAASTVPDTWLGATSCNGLSYLSPTSATLALQSHMEPARAVDHPRRWRDGIIAGMGMGGGDVMALQALLAEIQGMKKPRGFFNRHVRRILGMRPKPPPKYRMLLMMATNLPEALDEALLRPGRIDRIYKVGYPSKAGRIRTYEGYLAKVSHELTPEDVDKLATITPYATGATIKDLVNEALINAIRDGRETIQWPDVIRAKQLRELGLPEDVEYIDRERHAIAIHEACHAVSAYRVRHHLTIDLATLEKGGNYLGMVASIPPEDQFTRWRSEYEADIVVALASLAGERMFFEGDNSSGVSGDLDTATLIATYMEGYWGMGTTIASHGVTHRVGIGGGGGGGGPTHGETEKGRKQRELLEGHLGGRIERKLTDIFARAEELLRENRREVLSVAHALEAHKTLTGDDVRAVIDGTEGPLVDGRVYHAPGATELLEEYHREAVLAHAAHSHVDTALPAPIELAQAALSNGHANGKGSNGANGKGRTRRRRTEPAPSEE